MPINPRNTGWPSHVVLISNYLCLHAHRILEWETSRAYLFTCADTVADDSPMLNVTVSCDDFDSFKNFDVTEYLLCSESKCGLCAGYTCDEWFESDLQTCESLENEYVSSANQHAPSRLLFQVVTLAFVQSRPDVSHTTVCVECT